MKQISISKFLWIVTMGILCNHSMAQFNLQSFGSIINANKQSIYLGGVQPQSISSIGNGYSNELINYSISGLTQTTYIRYEVSERNWLDKFIIVLAAKRALQECPIEIYGGWTYAWPAPIWKQGIFIGARQSIEALANNFPNKKYSDYSNKKVRFAAVKISQHNPYVTGSPGAAYTFGLGFEVTKWIFNAK